MKYKYFLSRFKEYADKVENFSNIKLFWMFLICFVKYKCTIRDFFIFKFYAMSSYGKKLFVTGGQTMEMYKKINDSCQEKYLVDKEESFSLYSEFMSRMWCGVKHNNDLLDYKKFIDKNDECILKPLSCAGGKGVKKLVLKENFNEDNLKKLCEEKNCMVEEIIVQCDEMASLHSESVNSIRMVVIDKKIIAAVIRIGCGGKVVDNASSGGIFAEVDIDTGIVVSKAYNYKNESYILHPDTGKQIVGFKVPMWEKCFDMVKKAADILPGIPVKGFDIAITHSGPVFIEVNEGPAFELVQQTRVIGFDRKLIKPKQLIKKYGGRKK